MKYCYLTDREFKIAVVEKLSELQQDLEKQFNEFRNKINKQQKLKLAKRQKPQNPRNGLDQTTRH